MADSQSNAVAKRDESATKTLAMSPERAEKIAEAKARTAVARAIRGTQWGKDCAPAVVDALVAYCRQNQLDAVRHVEVLGGKIYLTADYYDEKGAALLHAGDVMFDEPDYINADPRLEELASAGDEWAKDEILRRKRERIRWNVPEQAKACVVTRAKLRSGMAVVGVNWCGNIPGGKKDPVGDAEPTKTAQTRSRRRAWKQVADFLPAYAQQVRNAEANAKNALPVAVVDPTAGEAVDRSVAQQSGDDPYGITSKQIEAGASNQGEESDEALLEQDRELAEAENRK